MTDLLDFDALEITNADPPDDVPPDPSGGGPSPEAGPTCEECGTLIPWSGRGRRPKRCAEHKARRTTPTVRQPRGKKAEDRLQTLEDDLLREFSIAGKGLAKFMPTAGVTLVSRAENTARALTRLAQDNPRLMQALETAAQIAPMLDLGETAGAVGVAILVDMGRINPDAVLPTLFGVRETYHAIHDDTSGEEMPQQVNGHGGFPEQSVPLRFQEIR